MTLVFNMGLQFLFKNIFKIQYFGFMVYMNIQFPYMLEDFYQFFNLNSKVNGNLYFISRLMGISHEVNKTFQLSNETIEHQMPPESFR